MSSGFVTEKEAEVDRAKRQAEWESVRKPTDPEEAPVDQILPTDTRPLFEKLQDNRMKEQEQSFIEICTKNKNANKKSNYTNFEKMSQNFGKFL